MFKVLVIFVASICGIQGQIPIDEKCPDYEVMQNFDASKYLGTWYEQARWPNIFELNGICTVAKYSVNASSILLVTNIQTNEITGESTSIEGYAVAADATSTAAKFLVNFPVGGAVADAPYWVLDTDYETYSVVWGCSDSSSSGFGFVWLLTRERNVSADVISTMYAVLEKSNINTSYLQTTNQENCS